MGRIEPGFRWVTDGHLSHSARVTASVFNLQCGVKLPVNVLITNLIG